MRHLITIAVVSAISGVFVGGLHTLVPHTLSEAIADRLAVKGTPENERIRMEVRDHLLAGNYFVVALFTFPYALIVVIALWPLARGHVARRLVRQRGREPDSI